MKRNFVRTIMAVALVYALSAAGVATAAPTLKLGAASNTGGMIVFVGVDKGFFAKNGLDAKVVVRNTGAQLTKSLKAGQIDFAPAAFTNLPAALERGIKVRGVVGYVGGSYKKSTTDEMVGIAVRPGKGIKSIKDLKGKKIGATFGSTGDLYLRTCSRETASAWAACAASTCVRRASSRCSIRAAWTPWWRGNPTSPAWSTR